MQGLVGAGIGYALVPLLTVNRPDADTTTLEVVGVPPREIALGWHRDRTLPPGAEAFVDVVRELAEELHAP